MTSGTHTAGGDPPFPGPGFTRFWAGETVSAFGSYVTLLALQTLVVLTLDGDAQDVGWLNATRWLPYLVLGLVIGALVDRWPRRPAMVATDLARAGLLALIPVAWGLDVLTLPLLLVVVLAFGTVSLVNDAASQSFMPRLVPGVHLQRAHARIDGADAVAQSAGPAVAGLLVKLVGAPLAVLVDAVTYLFSAAVVATLPVEEPARASRHDGADRPTPHLRREIVEGVRWAYGASGLARLAVSTHVWFAAQAILGVVVAPYALLVLDLSPFQLGVASAGAGVGAVAGATGSGALGRLLGTGGTIIGARLLAVVAAVVMAFAGLGTSGWAATAVLGAGQLIHGIGMGASNSHEMSYRQRASPDHLQARTNTTLRSLNRAVVVVGAPLAGLLTVVAGSRPALLVAAAVFAASAVLLLLSPFRSVRSEPRAGHPG